MNESLLSASFWRGLFYLNNHHKSSFADSYSASLSRPFSFFPNRSALDFITTRAATALGDSCERAAHFNRPALLNALSDSAEEACHAKTFLAILERMG
jgi:hypothetical protein